MIHEEADFVCAVNRVLVLGSCLALFIFLIDLLLLFALVIIILFVADLLFILALLLVEKVLLRILVIIVDHLVQRFFLLEGLHCVIASNVLSST